MASLQDLQNKMAQIAVDIAAVKVTVQALLAAGTLVNQGQLDALAASADTLDAAVKDITTPPGA